MLLMDGKLVSELRRNHLKERVAAFRHGVGREPGLGVVLVGDDPASKVYVGNKFKACRTLGFASFEVVLSAEATAGQLAAKIDEFNQNPLVDGFLVQMPLPRGLSSAEAIDRIAPEKDADGLTPSNLGLLIAGRPRVSPCTPSGVMALLEHYRIPLAGRRAVVVGRSQIVGRPMAELLLAKDATVTILHSKSEDIESHTQEADIVVVAAGRPEWLGRSAFKQGSVVVDVGIHRKVLSDGEIRLCGDVRFNELKDWVFAATPVPGGVGPMTITMLLENALTLAEKKLKS